MHCNGGEFPPDCTKGREEEEEEEESVEAGGWDREREGGGHNELALHKTRWKNR